MVGDLRGVVVGDLRGWWWVIRGSGGWFEGVVGDLREVVVGDLWKVVLFFLRLVAGAFMGEKAIGGFCGKMGCLFPVGGV